MFKRLQNKMQTGDVTVEVKKNIKTGTIILTKEDRRSLLAQLRWYSVMDSFVADIIRGAKVLAILIAMFPIIYVGVQLVRPFVNSDDTVTQEQSIEEVK